MKVGSALTSPITSHGTSKSAMHSAGTSARIFPYNGAKRRFLSSCALITAPRPLPNAILLTASAIPPAPIAYEDTI